MLIDEFLPRYDFTEHHHVDIAAPVEQVYAALRSADLARSPVVRALFTLRRLPTLLARGRGHAPHPSLTIDSLLQVGFVLLGEAPPHELVLGTVGRFWTPAGGPRQIIARDFAGFNEAGYAKAAWSFVLTQRPDGATRLSTETRVRCTDAASRRRFRTYWALIRPFSGLIRMQILRTVKRAAQRAQEPGKSP